MKRKEVTLSLKDEKITITLLGEEQHLSQINNKIKKMRFYCCGSEVSILTSGLVKILREEIENKEFTVASNAFAKSDVGNTFFMLEGGNYFFALNNKELRVPLTIPKWDILKDFYEMTKYCNTVYYRPEEEFKLKIV